MWRSSAFLGLAVIAVAGCKPTQPAPINYAAAHSLGRWCSKPTAIQSTWQLIEIIGVPKLQAKIVYGDGSKQDRDLEDGGGGTYRVANDIRGESYEIAGTNRDLRVMDQDGLVTIAERMERLQSPGECLDKEDS